jgi:hypothetical protein
MWQYKDVDLLQTNVSKRRSVILWENEDGRSEVYHRGKGWTESNGDGPLWIIDYSGITNGKPQVTLSSVDGPTYIDGLSGMIGRVSDGPRASVEPAPQSADKAGNGSRPASGRKPIDLPR